jgi:hypothetical protein
MRQFLIVSLIALGTALTPALAASSLEGQWRGSGSVSHRKSTDAVRCRVSFHRLSATSFSVSSQCTTETGRYDVTGRVAASGGNRYSGPVEGQGVAGTAVIVMSGNRLSVTVTSKRGSDKLSLSRL